jgi:NAD(P)-dependent dehydrogenase (short-subunit alcohol dehydrogenase family)
MAVKTLAIEWQHALPNATVIAYHPGTVQTPLSAPFERAHRNPLSPATAAQALFDLLPQLEAKDSGSFWDWQGQSIPW